MIEQSLVDILACPQCKKEVHVDTKSQTLVCERCRLRFPVRDDIPVMLVEEAEKF